MKRAGWLLNEMILFSSVYLNLIVDQKFHEFRSAFFRSEKSFRDSMPAVRDDFNFVAFAVQNLQFRTIQLQGISDPRKHVGED